MQRKLWVRCVIQKTFDVKMKVKLLHTIIELWFANYRK